MKGVSGRDRPIVMNFSMVVLTKASSGKFAVDNALYFIEQTCDTTERLIIKNDYDACAMYFIKDILKQREEWRTIVE